MFDIKFDENKLAEIIENAVTNALKDKTGEKQVEHHILHSIRELAEFLDCSTVTAQKYKNEGWIPYMQVGRKVMFDAGKVLKALEKKRR